MKPGQRLVIFDVDGTLIDSQNHIYAAMETAFSLTGQILPARAEVLGIVGLSLPEAVRQLVPTLPDGTRDRIVAAYKQSFNTAGGMAPPPLYPGARLVLDQLRNRSGVILGVATGKSRRGLDQMMSLHGLQGYFHTSQVADDHPSKPHPAMIHAALSEAQTARENAVMIGDTTFDIEMGRAAGVRTIGVSWGYHPTAALRSAGADHVIADYAAMIPLLDELWERP